MMTRTTAMEARAIAVGNLDTEGLTVLIAMKGVAVVEKAVT